MLTAVFALLLGQAPHSALAEQPQHSFDLYFLVNEFVAAAPSADGSVQLAVPQVRTHRVARRRGGVVVLRHALRQFLPPLCSIVCALAERGLDAEIAVVAEFLSVLIEVRPSAALSCRADRTYCDVYASTALQRLCWVLLCAAELQGRVAPLAVAGSAHYTRAQSSPSLLALIIAALVRCHMRSPPRCARWAAQS
jgi:hypothetical protein